MDINQASDAILDFKASIVYHHRGWEFRNLKS
jgi:hypothetical protein